MQNFKGVLGILAAGIAAAGLVVWFFYFNSPQPEPTTEDASSGFTTAPSRTSTAVIPSGTENGTLSTGGTSSASKIFKIADGPVVAATFVDVTRPTSTVVRYTMATNGHTFDLLLDSQGAVPKSVSNTTIPGIAEAFWSEQGRGVLLRYQDVGAIKTAHLSLPPVAATTSIGARIQFLPAGIARVAVSPDGTRIAYLIKTASGADGYVANTNGGEAQKVFSLPLSQVELTWPAAGTILAHSASSAGIGGIVFSIQPTTGVVTPLLYAEGVTATANRDFSRLVYQTSGTSRMTYAQNLRTGLSRPLSFAPIPELCRWSMATSTTMFCAAPITYVAPNFLEQLHTGLAENSMSLLSFNVDTGAASVVGAPGSRDGGVSQPIVFLAVSSNDNYLLYITKGDRSLWGVRLSQ